MQGHRMERTLFRCHPQKCLYGALATSASPAHSPPRTVILCTVVARSPLIPSCSGVPTALQRCSPRLFSVVWGKCMQDLFVPTPVAAEDCRRSR